MESKTFEIIKKKCSQCKVILPMTQEHFKLKRGGDFTKQCIKCLEMKSISRIKNYCEHNRQRFLCIECGGSSMCEHNRERNRCIQCKGVGICEHNRRRERCKECNAPIPITIKNMVYHSKQHDKKNNRYDQVNFIDYCFVKNLIDDCNNKCFYCDCELQYQQYADNLGTIERLDNSIGHIKGNCVIACRTCNFSKVGNIE